MSGTINKKWRAQISISCIGLVFAVGCSSSVSTVEIKGRAIYRVEVADTEELREKGLQGRRYLGAGEGMLFVFEQPKEVAFWMKDTFVALDLILIDRDGKINDIYKNLTPCREMECKIYSSKEVIDYALEVLSGEVEKRGIEIGDEVKIRIKT